MNENFHYGTGRRKTATARTRLYSGSGAIIVNGRPFQEYFNRKTLQMVVSQPLKLVNLEDKLEVVTGKTVKVRPHEDPKIIGGVIVRIGDKRIDGSVTGKLSALAGELMATK